MSLRPHAIHARLALSALLTVAFAATVAMTFARRMEGDFGAVDIFALTAWAGLVVTLVVLSFFERSVVRAVERLSAWIAPSREEGEEEDAPKPPTSVNDLVNQVEAHLEREATRQSEAVKCARMAGISDVSRALLHGMGNTLNSIQTAVHELDGQVKGMAVRDIGTLVAELEQHGDDLQSYLIDDRRGRFVIPFLKAVSEALERVQDAMAGELGSLRSNLDRVTELIHSQQNHVIGANLPEPVDLVDELVHAYELCLHSFDPERKVKVTQNFHAVPMATVDRYRLQGILQAMIQNALEAVALRPAEQRAIDLRVYRTYAGTAPTIALEVKDTGPGIDAALVDRVFESGFTTKDGAGGHGLHVAGNSAKELGGFMRVTSGGAFAGASQVLHLPVDETTGAARVPGPPKKTHKPLFTTAPPPPAVRKA